MSYLTWYKWHKNSFRMRATIRLLCHLVFKADSWWQKFSCWSTVTFAGKFVYRPVCFLRHVLKYIFSRMKCATPYTLLTCLDLYNSGLALASSPVLFWNLCVWSEIWISIVIYGLTAVAGQASITTPPPPPIQLHQKKNSLFFMAAASCARALSASLDPLPPPSILTLDYFHSCTVYILSCSDF